MSILSSHRLRTRAELILVFCTCIWAGTFAITKDALPAISPILLVAIRFSIASGMALPGRWKAVASMTRKEFLAGTVLGALLFAGFALQTIGLQWTSASKSAFLTGLMVVFTPFFQIFFERKLPGIGSWIGILAVAAGLYLLTSPSGGFSAGDLLTLACAVIYGLYIVLLDIYTKKYNLQVMTFLQLGVTAVAAIIGAVMFERPVFHPSPGLFFAIGYLALLATFMNLNLQARYQRETTPTRAAIIYSLEPVIAASIAALALGESLGWSAVLGGGLIVAGLLCSELSDVLFGRLEKLEGNEA